MKKLIGAIIIFTIFGCAPINLPMHSTLNDYLVMGIKPNSNVKVSVNYSSLVQDGVTFPYTKDKQSQISGHMGYNHTEATTLERMVRELIGNKFMVEPTSDTNISIILKDFYLEQYSTDSTGQQILVALGGGEINMILSANVKVLLRVKHGEKEFSKILIGRAEEQFVSGVGTGTSTSHLYRGKDSIESCHARNINSANNKVLMFINRQLEDMGL